MKLGKHGDLRTLMLRVLYRPEKDTEKNTPRYWNTRWTLNLQADRAEIELLPCVKETVERNDCKTVLEVGCGAYVPLRKLPHCTHLDFSLNALKRSGLDSFIFADITKGIPVPDDTFDASFSSACLMHIPDELIAKACYEIARVTKRLIILNEGSARDLSKYFPDHVCEQLEVL